MRERIEDVKAIATAVRAIVALYLIVVTAYGVFSGQDSDLPRCAHEYSQGPCVWRAQTSGNGIGSDVVNE